MTLVDEGTPAAPRTVSPALPAPRGPLSAAVLAALVEPAGPFALPNLEPADVLDDDDFQLALYCCYELHYRSFAGVDPAWEWSPPLLAARRTLETVFERQLTEQVGGTDAPADLRAALGEVATGTAGRSLSSYMEDEGTVAHMQEFCVHRSAYQLKEADPHTWAIPRVNGAAKAAIVEIQVGEYGGGVESAMHAVLFADTMAALGLDPTYGAYLDVLPGPTLATVNLVSMFGLHRRWRGALVGHLALFELTSVTPMGRYSRCLERLGYGPAARRFYDAHVTADAIHSVVALERLVPALVTEDPDLAGDVLFGAKAAVHVEARFAQSLFDAWTAGESSLLSPG